MRRVVVADRTLEVGGKSRAVLLARPDEVVLTRAQALGVVLATGALQAVGLHVDLGTEVLGAALVDRELLLTQHAQCGLDVLGGLLVAAVADRLADAVEAIHGAALDVLLELRLEALLTGEAAGFEVVQLAVARLGDSPGAAHGDQLGVDVSQVAWDDLNQRAVSVAVEGHGLAAHDAGQVRALGHGLRRDREEVDELGGQAALVALCVVAGALVQHGTEAADELVELLQLLTEVLRDQAL